MLGINIANKITKADNNWRRRMNNKIKIVIKKLLTKHDIAIPISKNKGTVNIAKIMFIKPPIKKIMKNSLSKFKGIIKLTP